MFEKLRVLSFVNINKLVFVDNAKAHIVHDFDIVSINFETYSHH